MGGGVVVALVIVAFNVVIYVVVVDGILLKFIFVFGAGVVVDVSGNKVVDVDVDVEVVDVVVDVVNASGKHLFVLIEQPSKLYLLQFTLIILLSLEISCNK